MAVQRLRRRRVPTTSYARLENAALDVAPKFYPVVSSFPAFLLL